VTLDGTEKVADVDYQDAGKMKIHVGSSRLRREGGLFYAVVAKQSLAATHRIGRNPRSYSDSALGIWDQVSLSVIHRMNENVVF
jgi:hypothetical protein